MDCLKKSIKLIIATLITLTIGVTVSSTAQAATVHYVDYDKTTENVRKEIKQGKPTEADLKDGSHAVYVYRKNNTCGVSIPKRGPELPNTGTVANTVSAVFAVVLVAGGLYLVKSNKMRNIAKTVLVLGGLGTFFAFQGEVLAADSSILGQIIEQMNLDPEEIDCYDYVGFYISEETTTAGPTTTVVTTEATTTTETKRKNQQQRQKLLQQPKLQRQKSQQLKRWQQLRQNLIQSHQRIVYNLKEAWRFDMYPLYWTNQ